MSGPASRPLVSVCVPAYKRPDLLEFALRSIIEQDYAAVEILIGDDSPTDAAEPVVARMRTLTEFPIRYRRNTPKLGQPRNVDSLFAEAAGDYLILLHDDDVLLANAITNMMEPVLRDSRVRVVFGKQNVINADGTLHVKESAEREAIFQPDSAAAIAARPIEACLLQQLPNDAYLMETKLAQTLGYVSDRSIEVYVDTSFGIRLGQALKPGEMQFVDTLVASYRRSADAVSMSKTSKQTNHPVAAVALYHTVGALDLPPASEFARQTLLRAVIDATVKGFALEKKRLTALRLFWSSNYGWRKRLSMKGAYHLALIASPSFDRIRKY